MSREDRLRVRVSLAEDSDEWGASLRLGGVTSAATSRVGVVDEEAAVCSWNGPGQAVGTQDWVCVGMTILLYSEKVCILIILCCSKLRRNGDEQVTPR